MSYPDPKHTKEVQKRYHRFSDSGKKPFSEFELKILERDFQYFLRDAGIPLGEDRKIPETNGVPRIFVLGLDDEGNEKPMTPQEAGIDMSPNSPEFWQQVGMGNVFAYPAGSRCPVQLQAKADKNSVNDIFSYSEPVEPEKMPAREIRQPGVFARFFNRISGGRWFKEVTAYDKQQDRLEFKYDLSVMNGKRGQEAEDELVEAEEAIRQRKAQAKQKALEDELAKARELETEFQKGYENLHSVYKPIPEKKDHLLKTKNKSGLYTEEQFKDLKPIGKDKLDLDKIIIAPKGALGKAASEKDFCAVAMFAGKKYQNAAPAKDSSQITDIHAIDGFKKNLGLTDAQARQLHADAYSNLFTTDLFHTRDNTGMYFKVGVNNARQDAADAFNAYKNGDKEPLAKLIAFGIDRACAETVGVDGPPGDTTKGTFRMGAHLVTLLDRDPELKDLALENGLTEKQLKTVAATSEYLKLDDARTRAKVKLLEAASEHRELPAAEKRACMEAIIKPTLVEKIWHQENNTEDEKQLEAKSKILNVALIPEGKDVAWNKNPASRPAPPEGKFWADTGARFVENVKQLYKPVPKVVTSLNDQTELDKVAKRIAAEDQVEKMSCEELVNFYTGKTADTLPRRIMQIAGEAQAGKAAQEENRNVRREQPKAEKKEEPEIDLDNNLNIDELMGNARPGGPSL